MFDLIFRFGTYMNLLLLQDYFINCFRDNRKTYNIKKFILSLILASVVTVGTYSGNTYYRIFIPMITTFIYSWRIDTIRTYKYGMTITYLSLVLTVQYLTKIYFLLLYRFGNSENLLTGKIHVFIFNVIFTLIIISLCHMFGNRQIRLQSLSHEIIYTLIAFSAILTLMCVGTFWVVETVATKEIYYYSMGIITGALILFYMGLYMIKTITHFVDHEHKCNRKIAQIEQNMRHYDELNTIYCKMKKIKHDLKNSMCTLIHIMEDGNIDKLRNTLQLAYDEIKDLDAEMYTFNPYVNSILRAKLGMAKKKNITVTASVFLPDELSIGQKDIGVLFGNILDNAIEACEKLPEAVRYIDISTKIKGNHILIYVKNSKQFEKKTHHRTSKIDFENHGYGKESVEEIFKRYNGWVSFNDCGNSYETIGNLCLKR